MSEQKMTIHLTFSDGDPDKLLLFLTDYLKALPKVSDISIVMNPKEQRKIAYWCTDDVHTAAANAGLEITDEEADDVLDTLEHEFDASLGMCWDDVERALEESGYGTPKPAEDGDKK
jgi:hypothetical protein